MTSNKFTQATCRGIVSKNWRLDDNKNAVLVKGSTVDEHRIIGYEPFSEAIASVVADKIGIRHIKYELDDSSKYPEIKTRGLYVSKCMACVINKDEQKMTAFQLIKYIGGLTECDGINKAFNIFVSIIKNNEHLKNSFIEMMLFDAIIGNEDRHLNNWEYIITKDKFIYQYPVYDNGRSLLFYLDNRELKNKPEIPTGRGITRDTAKPFAETHTAQMNLIKKTFPEYRIKYNIDDTWKSIEIGIEPILKLMNSKRAAYVKYYLYKRFCIFSELFNGGALK
ncbi:MAG: hypothetical protein IJ593_04700 [Lachnospiraceae bacterium]|nr:hypothetical protein [Lachnospiraceae bacterium]